MKVTPDTAAFYGLPLAIFTFRDVDIFPSVRKLIARSETSHTCRMLRVYVNQPGILIIDLVVTIVVRLDRQILGDNSNIR